MSYQEEDYYLMGRLAYLENRPYDVYGKLRWKLGWKETELEVRKNAEPEKR